jgi:hypothetical protein
MGEAGLGSSRETAGLRGARAVGVVVGTGAAFGAGRGVGAGKDVCAFPYISGNAGGAVGIGGDHAGAAVDLGGDADRDETAGDTGVVVGAAGGEAGAGTKGVRGPSGSGGVRGRGGGVELWVDPPSAAGAGGTSGSLVGEDALRRGSGPSTDRDGATGPVGSPHDADEVSWPGRGAMARLPIPA